MDSGLGGRERLFSGQWQRPLRPTSPLSLRQGTLTPRHQAGTIPPQLVWRYDVEEQRKMTVHLEMKFSTAFIIGLGLALAGLVVMLIPWIIMLFVALPLSVNTW